MSRYRDHLRTGGFVVLCAMALFPVALPLLADAGRIEGRVFPVAGKIAYPKLSPDGDGALVWPVFDKHRDCRFLSLDFYDASGPALIRVHVDFEPDSRGQSRPAGHHVAGPWSIAHPDPASLLVEVRHRCHPLWDTITRM